MSVSGTLGMEQDREFESPSQHWQHTSCCLDTSGKPDGATGQKAKEQEQ